jgi:hypothetical protein
MGQLDNIISDFSASHYYDVHITEFRLQKHLITLQIIKGNAAFVTQVFKTFQDEDVLAGGYCLVHPHQLIKLVFTCVWHISFATVINNFLLELWSLILYFELILIVKCVGMLNWL